MGISLTYFVRDHRTYVDLGSGLFLGWVGSFCILYVFSRVNAISSIPTRLLFDYFEVSLFSTLLRILALLIPISIGLVIAMPWIQMVITAPNVFGYSIHHLAYTCFLVGLPVSILVLIQYLIFVAFLDSRWGYGLEKVDLPKVDFSADSGTRIFYALEEQISNQIVFGTSRYLDSTLERTGEKRDVQRDVVTYGGLLVRPRVVISARLKGQLKGDRLISFLLNQVIHIRRGDLFFETLFGAAEKLPIKSPRFLATSHSRGCDSLCGVELAARLNQNVMFKPELRQTRSLRWIVAALCMTGMCYLGWSQVRDSLVYHKKYVKQVKIKEPSGGSREAPEQFGRSAEPG